MSAGLSSSLSRRDMAIAALSFAGTVSAVSGYGAISAHEARLPRVSVLGAGSHLALLITDGPARLLLAAGDDTTAFGNAWAASLPPLLRRVDVLYCSPLPADAPVVEKATRDLSYRHRRVLHATETGIAPSQPETWSEQVRLSGRITVTVSASVLAPSDGSTIRPIWAAEVSHTATRIVTLSEPGAASLLGDLTASALVLQDGDPREALALVETAALISTGSSKTLRQRLSAHLERPLWHIRVFSGEVARLPFVPGGLRLPDTAITIQPSDPADGVSPRLSPSGITG